MQVTPKITGSSEVMTEAIKLILSEELAAAKQALAELLGNL